MRIIENLFSVYATNSVVFWVCFCVFIAVGVFHITILAEDEKLRLAALAFLQFMVMVYASSGFWYMSEPLLEKVPWHFYVQLCYWATIPILVVWTGYYLLMRGEYPKETRDIKTVTGYVSWAVVRASKNAYIVLMPLIFLIYLIIRGVGWLDKKGGKEMKM